MTQDPCHRSCRYPNLETNPVLPRRSRRRILSLPRGSRRRILSTDCSTDSRVRVGVVAWSPGPVLEPLNPLGLEAIKPGLHALARHTHRSREVCLTPTLLMTLNDQEPTVNGQPSTTVRRGPPGGCEPCNKPHPTRRFSSRLLPRRCHQCHDGTTGLRGEWPAASCRPLG